MREMWNYFASCCSLHFTSQKMTQTRSFWRNTPSSFLWCCCCYCCLSFLSLFHAFTPFQLCSPVLLLSIPPLVLDHRLNSSSIIFLPLQIIWIAWVRRGRKKKREDESEGEEERFWRRQLFSFYPPRCLPSLLLFYFLPSFSSSSVLLGMNEGGKAKESAAKIVLLFPYYSN